MRGDFTTTGGVFTKAGANLIWKKLYGSSETAVSQFGYGTNSTTATTSDTALGTELAKKDIVPGYPSYDATNLKVTSRGFISTSEGNGSTITEVGEFNKDGTPVMISRDVVTGVAKTDGTELAIIWVHRITL